MRAAVVGLVASTLCLGGCASVVRGTTETLAFTSTPPGAAVALSDGLACAATPCFIEVPRKDELAATFSKPGYQPQSVRVTTKVGDSGVVAGAGNIIAGGVIGVGVDALNGANLDHYPNPVDATLQPAPAGPAKRRGSPVS